MNFIQLKYWPYYMIAALLLYIMMTGTSEPVEVQIPVKKGSVEVKNPVPEKVFDTVYIDTTDKKRGFRVIEVENPLNEELKAAYDAAVKENDSLKQQLLFYSAITERKYTERLEDSLQIITVKSDVVGTLKNQSISYQTKPQTVTVQPNRERPVLYVGGFTSFPVSAFEISQTRFGLQAQLSNQKNSFTLGIDNERNVQVGWAKKLF